MANSGDKVKIILKEGNVHQGILMPEDKEYFVDLKLSSGYNIGIDKKNIKKIEVIAAKKEVKKSSLNLPVDKKKKTISILHTGGTIASKVNYETGGVIASFELDDLLAMFPELKEIANLNSVLVSNMMSEDMRFSHYQKLAKAVKAEVEKGVDGIIIGHGTDTLTVTSAALSFMLENIPIPVILVGSQRSSDRGSTDAAMNMICASEFIVKEKFQGVAICMHEEMSDNNCLIMSGTKTKKFHTSRRDAFRVVNDTPFARVNYETRKVTKLKDYPKVEGNFQVLDKFEEKVTIIRTHNNMSKDFFEVLNTKGYRGLILEGTGIGHAPTNIKENFPIYEELKKFIANGGIVVETSQCIFGRVHADIYTNTRRLADIGILFGEDMLTDTAFVKLSWLLGNNPKEAKELITQNLRGEITKRTEKDTFLD